MTSEQALEILRLLADGVDPSSGREMPEGGTLQQPHVIRALLVATRALEQQAERTRRRARQPAQSGRSWTDEEDERLVRGFDADQPLARLAEAHGRTLRAIRLRLLKLGRV